MKSKWLEKRRHQQSVYFAITGPAISAIHMLKLAPTDPGLNLATVRRNLDWCFSTYDYLGDQLSHSQQRQVNRLLNGLQREVLAFDWKAVGEKARDGWDDAMAYYNGVD